jgi:peptidoglycan/xylan/chitin deacetylase (PgdA/CDA1 family)
MQILLRILGAFLVAAAACFASLAQPQQRSVALTFDDLPSADTSDPSEARFINLKILHALDQHHAAAVGFVIESRVQEIGEARGKALLDEWTKRKYDLGNHTFSHIASDKLTAEQFEQGIVKGEASLAAALAKVGKTPRYFRFPQNHTGDTKEKHDAIAAFLAQRGYKLAVCTVENEDFAFNEAYLKMLSSKDRTSAAKLRADYLAYTSTEIDYYAGLQKQLFGREIPHVMVLHVNRLNADLMDELLGLFEQRQYRFVTLDAALSDDAYKTPDNFIPRFARYGPMWAYRWAAQFNIQVDGSLEPEPPGWITDYSKD